MIFKRIFNHFAVYWRLYLLLGLPVLFGLGSAAGYGLYLYAPELLLLVGLQLSVAATLSIYILGAIAVLGLGLYLIGLLMEYPVKQEIREGLLHSQELSTDDEKNYQSDKTVARFIEKLKTLTLGGKSQTISLESIVEMESSATQQQTLLGLSPTVKDGENMPMQIEHDGKTLALFFRDFLLNDEPTSQQLREITRFIAEYKQSEWWVSSFVTGFLLNAIIYRQSSVFIAICEGLKENGSLTSLNPYSKLNNVFGSYLSGRLNRISNIACAAACYHSYDKEDIDLNRILAYLNLERPNDLRQSSGFDDNISADYKSFLVPRLYLAQEFYNKSKTPAEDNSYRELKQAIFRQNPKLLESWFIKQEQQAQEDQNENAIDKLPSYLKHRVSYPAKCADLMDLVIYPVNFCSLSDRLKLATNESTDFRNFLTKKLTDYGQIKLLEELGLKENEANCPDHTTTQFDSKHTEKTRTSAGPTNSNESSPSALNFFQADKTCNTLQDTEHGTSNCYQ